MASRRFTDAFRASLSFHVVSWPSDRSAEDALLANAARGVLIIPGNFSRTLARGRTSEVQLLVDATDSNTARIVASIYQPDRAGVQSRPDGEENPDLCRRADPALVQPGARLTEIL